MKKLQFSLSLIAGLLAIHPVYAEIATPTQYTVTLSEVAFHKTTAPANSYTVYANGSTQVNIASVGAGQPCGSLNPTGNLTPGSYDTFRFTVSKTMVVKGASTGNLANGLPCRTIAGGAVVTDPMGDGSISEAYLGSTADGTPEAETVVVPSGSGVTLPSGFVDLGSSFQASMPISMNVSGSVPTGTVSFDVTNSIQFEAYGLTQCLVFPLAPTVTVNIA